MSLKLYYRCRTLTYRYGAVCVGNSTKGAICFGFVNISCGFWYINALLFFQKTVYNVIA